MPETSEIAERFKNETARHELTILRDDGLYRHLRFRAPSTGFYWFDLVTWPGYLSFTGDMDGFMFSRIRDMFQFFRGDGYGINPVYWSEKLVAGRDGAKVYNEDLFKRHVAEDLKDAEERYPGVTASWTERVDGIVPEYYTATEYEARAALDDFEYQPEGASGEPFRFESSWEWELRDYSWNFLWACHGIQWGIGQYDKQTAPTKAGGTS